MKSQMHTPISVIATEVVLPGIVEPTGLQIRERVLAPLHRGEALVQIEASGVSFAEQAMRRGLYPMQPAFPFVPGYDFVGRLIAVGKGVPQNRIGTRVAAVTKLGGWASHVVVPARHLVCVPEEVSPAQAETVLVNGITAWQMLFREAEVKAGQTILVHGANGGVGTVLCQLAHHFGIRVIGTASPRHHDALRAMGVEPLDYNAPDLAEQVRALAPAGVDAVFDHLGLESARISYGLLARKGSLIVYGNALAFNQKTSMMRVFLRLMGQLALWKLRPKAHYVTFYNFWGGRLLRPSAFRARLAQDLTTLFDLLRTGAIDPPIAAAFPITEAAAAMTLAESRTVRGKVILVP
ncbi:MAG: medium chain dehydrogenase/reductase family protein [Janthinobacterium lividum]